MSEIPAHVPQSALARSITLISATILIAAQTITAAVAGGWAIAGFLGLGEYAAYALEAIGLGLGVWAVVAFVKSAVRNARSEDV
ncbi:hypothetical protein [Methylopila sp. M107]|uniref:hypothetical protein n=1 Tax=Methylopila sp. M107 TaxID=1101190 RepID=UPI0003747F5F|nr:hypothetical protein [Methylopila sp. M107]